MSLSYPFYLWEPVIILHANSLLTTCFGIMFSQSMVDLLILYMLSYIHSKKFKIIKCINLSIYVIYNLYLKIFFPLIKRMYSFPLKIQHTAISLREEFQIIYVDTLHSKKWGLIPQLVCCVYQLTSKDCGNGEMHRFSGESWQTWSQPGDQG